MKQINEKLNQAEQKLTLLKDHPDLAPEQQKKLSELSGYLCLYRRFFKDIEAGDLLISDLGDFKKMVRQYCQIIDSIT